MGSWWSQGFKDRLGTCSIDTGTRSQEDLCDSPFVRFDWVPKTCVYHSLWADCEYGHFAAQDWVQRFTLVSRFRPFLHVGDICCSEDIR